MGNIQPVRCQKCAKPLGYISVFAKGFAGMQQRLENIKVVAVCMDCYRKNNVLVRRNQEYQAEKSL